MDTATAAVDPGQVILDRIAALEVERACVEARISQQMLVFQDHARVEADRHTDRRLRDIEYSAAADHLGAVLHQPTKIVQDRLAQTRRVRNLLPMTWLAHLSGRIDAYRVSLISSAAQKLTGDNHNLIHLDGIIGPYAATHTAAQLRGKLKRFVARWAPLGEAAKAEKAKRGVWVTHGDDGMSWLNAYLPTADVIRIETDLNVRAKAASSADGLTMDQRKADTLVAQLRGILTGQSISSRAVIGITVPCTSLAGLTDEPGESFDGSFALPAEMVRELASEPGTLFYRVINDPAGRILDITELGRFPSAKLRVAVDIRDGTCRMPTCSTPAMRCDLDHQVPHPDGATTGSNLRALCRSRPGTTAATGCRRHHNLKTHRITEPTTLTMDPPRPSSPAHDLATYAVHWTYAA